jgi:hypothetical protein
MGIGVSTVSGNFHVTFYSAIRSDESWCVDSSHQEDSESTLRKLHTHPMCVKRSPHRTAVEHWFTHPGSQHALQTSNWDGQGLMDSIDNRMLNMVVIHVVHYWEGGRQVCSCTGARGH